MKTYEKGRTVKIILVILLLIGFLGSAGYIVYDKLLKREEVKQEEVDKKKENIKEIEEKNKTEQNKEISFTGDKLDFIGYNDNEIYYINKDGALLYGVKKENSSAYEFTKVNIEEKVNQINYEYSCAGDRRVFALDEKGNLYVGNSNSISNNSSVKAKFMKVESKSLITGLTSENGNSVSCSSNYIKFTSQDNTNYYGQGSCSNNGALIENFSLNTTATEYSSCMPK